MDQPPSEKPTRLAFVGDLQLGREVSARITGGVPPAAIWGDMIDPMNDVDAVVGNLECAVTKGGEPWPRPKAFRFRADPVVVEALTAGNVRCVALANNHVLDYSAEGLADTRAHLAAAGIAAAGAGANRHEALTPALFKAGRVTIGFAAITNTVPAFAARSERAGTAYAKIGDDAGGRALLAGLAANLGAGGADIRILSIHWGPNYRPWPPQGYRRFARRAIDTGFDIVHGHSAHILQAVEFHGAGVILYDTGDFIDDFLVIPPFRSDRSFLFVVEAERGRVVKLTLHPVSLKIGEVNRARGREADAIRRGMIRRCSGYAVDLTEVGDSLVGIAKPA